MEPDQHRLASEGEGASKVGKTVSGIADEAVERVKRVTDDGKDIAASRVARIGRALHSASEELRSSDEAQLARYVDVAGERLTDLSSRLRDRSPDELVREVESFARHSPGVFLGGAFAVGLAIGRVLRAGGNGNGHEQNESELRELSGGGTYRGTSFRRDRDTPVTSTAGIAPEGRSGAGFGRPPESEHGSIGVASREIGSPRPEVRPPAFGSTSGPTGSSGSMSPHQTPLGSPGQPSRFGGGVSGLGDRPNVGQPNVGQPNVGQPNVGQPSVDRPSPGVAKPDVSGPGAPSVERDPVPGRGGLEKGPAGPRGGGSHG